MWYTGFSTFCAVYVVMATFPIIIRSLYAPPITFADLEDENFSDKKTRERFQSIFIILLQGTSTMVCTGLTLYYFYRFQVSTLTFFEILGVLGGFLSLLNSIQRTIGSILLSLLHRVKMGKNTLEFTKSIVGN
jgi:hypothetical protein